MNVFEAVKENITARQAAEMYGLKVTRKGMACCPFHQDRTPSMKFDKRFHCFGCGADGDAIDFIADYFGLSKLDAAKKLAEEFGLQVEDDRRNSGQTSVKPKPPPVDPQKEAAEWISQAIRTLIDYRWLLRDFEECDRPQSMDEDFDDHPLFCLALQQKDYIDYLIDELMDCGKDQYVEMKKSCGKEVDKIAKRLGRFNAGREKAAGR